MVKIEADVKWRELTIFQIDCEPRTLWSGKDWIVKLPECYDLWAKWTKATHGNDSNLVKPKNMSAPLKGDIQQSV